MPAMARHLVHWMLLSGVSLLLWAVLALGFYFMLGGSF